MRRILALAFALVSLGLVAGCGSESDSDTGPASSGEPVKVEPIGAGPEIDPSSLRAATQADLDGDFVSVGIEGKTLPEGVQAQIHFEPDYFSATVGCNAANGSYSFDRGTLKHEGVSITEMFCGDDLALAEDWLVNFVTEPLKVRTDGEVLVLEGAKATLKVAPKSEATPVIEHRRWELTSIGDGETVAGVPAGVRATTLTFRDGNVTYTGCNQGFGKAEIGEGSIEFGPIKLTKRSCGQEADQVESQVMDVLGGEVAANWHDQNLVLSRDGKSLTFALDETE